MLRKPCQLYRSYISSIEPGPAVVCKFSVYNPSLGAKDECVNVSVNQPICETPVTHFRECAVNIRREVFKVFLSSLSISTVSVPPANVVEVTATPT